MTRPARRRALSVILGVAVACLSATEAGAQGRNSGFRFGQAKVAFGYDTGLAIAGQQGLASDRLIEVVPGLLGYSRSTVKSTLQFQYQPQFEMFGDFSFLDTWNHNAIFSMSRQLTRELTIRGGGSYLKTNDRSQQANTLTLSGRGRFVEGALFVDGTYRINPYTSVQFRADGRVSESQFGVDTTSSDQLLNSYRVGVSRSVGIDRLVTVGYTYFRSRILRQDNVDPTVTPAPIRDEPAQSIVNVDYSERLRSGWQFGGSFGVIVRPDRVTDTRYTYMLAGSFSRSWNSVVIGGGYNRTLSALVLLFTPAPAGGLLAGTPGAAPGQTPGTTAPAPIVPSDPTIQSGDPFLATRVAETFDFSLETVIARRFRLQPGVQLIRTDLADVDDRLETLFTSVVLTIRAARRLEPYVGATYWYQTTSSVAASSSRTRILFGLQFSWDRPVRAGRGI